MNIEQLAAALAPLSAADKASLAALLAPELAKKPRRRASPKATAWDGDITKLDQRTASERWRAGEETAKRLPKSRMQATAYRRVMTEDEGDDR